MRHRINYKVCSEPLSLESKASFENGMQWGTYARYDVGNVWDMFSTNLYISKLSFVIFNPHAEHVVWKISQEYPTPSVSRKANVDLAKENTYARTGPVCTVGT